MITKLINAYTKEISDLISYCITLTYFMRGAIQYQQMLETTFAERELIEEFLKKRFDVEAKNPYPNY